MVRCCQQGLRLISTSSRNLVSYTSTHLSRCCHGDNETRRQMKQISGEVSKPSQCLLSLPSYPSLIVVVVVVMTDCFHVTENGCEVET